jgi:hypothetical protein
MMSCTLSAADSARLPHLALPKLEVMFADGSSAWLHQVHTDGQPELYVREIQDGPARRTVDLRHLVPTLQHHMPAARPADQASIVFLTLRGQYASAGDFLRAVRERTS